MKKTIKLDSNFRIESDSNNWVLIATEEKEHKSGPKKGQKFISEDNRYYNSINQCLSKYVDESLKPCKCAKDILTKLDELKEVIDKK